MIKDIIPGLLRYVDVELPGGGFSVGSFLIEGRNDRMVVDSLMRPRDMEPFVEASMVVYTHADWDHCWGSMGLPRAQIIGHEAARKRLLDTEAHSALKRWQERYPEFFQGAAIVPPSITFNDQLFIDLGGVTVNLSHCPGHTADSITIQIMEHDIMLVGDALEEPIPYTNELGYVRQWVKSLRSWSRSTVTKFYCSHSHNVLTTADVNCTALYFEWLLSDVEGLLRTGALQDEIIQRLPLTKYLGDASTPAGAHALNIQKIIAELLGER